MKRLIFTCAFFTLFLIPAYAVAVSSSASSSSSSASASSAAASANSSSAGGASSADSSSSEASSATSSSASASAASASYLTAEDAQSNSEAIAQIDEDTNINIFESGYISDRHYIKQVATIQNGVQASASPTVSASTVPTGYCQSEIEKINESTSQMKDQNNRILKLFIVNLILLAIILALTAAVLFKKPRVNISRIPEI